MASEEFVVPDFYNPDDWEAIANSPKTYQQTSLGRWVYKQSELGEVVVPIYTKVAQTDDGTESVIWAERRLIDENGMHLRRFQVLCDHVLDMSPQDINDTNFSCQGVAAFIKWSAMVTRQRMTIDEVLGSYGHLRKGIYVPEEGKRVEDEQFLEQIIGGVVNQVKVRPEQCHGNTASDRHSITGMTYVVGKPRPKVLKAVRNLQSSVDISLEENEVIHLRAL